MVEDEVDLIAVAVAVDSEVVREAVVVVSSSHTDHQTRSMVWQTIGRALDSRC